MFERPDETTPAGRQVPGISTETGITSKSQLKRNPPVPPANARDRSDKCLSRSDRGLQISPGIQLGEYVTPALSKPIILFAETRQLLHPLLKAGHLSKEPIVVATDLNKIEILARNVRNSPRQGRGQILNRRRHPNENSIKSIQLLRGPNGSPQEEEGDS
jgi:hypothetical protein